MYIPRKISRKYKVLTLALLFLFVIGVKAYPYLGSKASGNTAHITTTVKNPSSNNKSSGSSKQDSKSSITYNTGRPSLTAANEPTISTTGWRTFASSAEGFTLKYPSDWTVTNAYQNSGGYYDFKAPDGLIVRYAYLGSQSTDSLSCGQGATCIPQDVLSLDTLRIPNYKSISLVTLAPNQEAGSECYEAVLDLPSGQSTTPKVGINTYNDHEITFSLPSKNSGRFAIFTTNTIGPKTTFSCVNMTQDQFFSTKSVQQAIQILKSISY